MTRFEFSVVIPSSCLSFSYALYAELSRGSRPYARQDAANDLKPSGRHAWAAAASRRISASGAGFGAGAGHVSLDRAVRRGPQAGAGH